MASGYLIVTRFEVLYDAALRSGRYDQLPHPIYGVPHRSSPVPQPGRPRYRGIDRQPLEALSADEARDIAAAGTPCEATPATVLLATIEAATARKDGWLTTPDDVLRVWAALGGERARREVIFAREHFDDTPPPAHAEYLGADTAHFVVDHFSCICDALFIPRWHGTDEEGVLFRAHFDKLNRNGLFDTNADALDYLQYYLSFDWTERDENFTSIEVYAVAMPDEP
jgi:hypothetical protein